MNELTTCPIKLSESFHEMINIDKIKNSLWFDNFTKVTINEKVNLPINITHLTFDNNFNESINGYVPSTVTHLTFGKNFNQKLVTYYPIDYDLAAKYSLMLDSPEKYATEIELFKKEHKYIGKAPDYHVPNGVTHVVFGEHFNQDIKECLPPSIKEIVCVGNINREWKSEIIRLLENAYDDLLYETPTHGHIRLVFVGDGDGEMMQIVFRNNPDYVLVGGNIKS